MKKIISILCIVLCLSSLLPMLLACGEDNVYELGPYSINEEEYAYLLSTHKRKVMESMGLDESHLDSVVDSSSGMTYNQYIEKAHREEFEQSVYTLLFSLALFDENNLKLTKEEKATTQRAARSVINAYGNGKASTFNSRVKDYGFSDDAIYSIYEKQAMETKLVQYLYGSGYSKVKDSEKEDYYQSSYIHFQIIVLNTLYYKNGDSYVNYSKEEQATRKQLEKELTDLLCSGKLETEHGYKTLKAYIGKDVIVTNDAGEKVFNVTYEELWSNSEINDDSLYPGGYYMTKPTLLQMMSKTPTTLSVATITKEGDVSVLAAKRFFDGSGTIDGEDGKTTINKGDYFEYGAAFIKRLPIDEKAWKNEKNKDFFTDFLPKAAQHTILKAFQEYEKNCPYTLMVQNELKAEYSLSTIYPNYIDYDFLYSKED